MNRITRIWKVYGVEGHRQRESFRPSSSFEPYVNGKQGSVSCALFNSDRTGTNDFSIIKITARTAEECYDRLEAQISDGAFEDSNVGKIEEITNEELRHILEKKKELDLDEAVEQAFKDYYASKTAEELEKTEEELEI